MKDRKDTVVIVRADKNLPYGAVENFIRTVNRYVGNRAVAIATQHGGRRELVRHDQVDFPVAVQVGCSHRTGVAVGGKGPWGRERAMPASAIRPCSPPQSASSKPGSPTSSPVRATLARLRLIS